MLGCRHVRLHIVCVLLNRIGIPSQRAHLHSGMRMYIPITCQCTKVQCNTFPCCMCMCVDALQACVFLYCMCIIMTHCRLQRTLQKAFVKALEHAATGLLMSTKRCKLGSPTAAFTSCTVASLLQPKSSSCINHAKHAPPAQDDTVW